VIGFYPDSSYHDFLLLQLVSRHFHLNTASSGFALQCSEFSASIEPAVACSEISEVPDITNLLLSSYHFVAVALLTPGGFYELRNSGWFLQLVHILVCNVT
jgi:hypothetical protein